MHAHLAQLDTEFPTEDDELFFFVMFSDKQVDERHVYLCAAAPLKEDMDYILDALFTGSFKVHEFTAMGVHRKVGYRVATTPFFFF